MNLHFLHERQLSYIISTSNMRYPRLWRAKNMEIWCQENFGESAWDTSDGIWCVDVWLETWYFRYAEDACAFKLRWF